MNCRFLFTAALLGSTLTLCAQNITGRIIDSKTKQPLDFVNVALTRDGSTHVVKGAVTDEEGNFALTGIAAGNYELRVTFIGYGSLDIPIVLTAQKPSRSLGNIAMTEDSKMLKEVEVTGQKSQMRFEVDKKVFDVDQNIASAGASASDALANIPSVTVDNEGNVSLRNNSSVTIWINGRPSGLSEENRAQILEQLPADAIQSVEIITNPSARFSAEGTAGIINIVMKKEKRTGYFGGVNANADTHGGYGVGANVSVTHNALEANLSLGYRRRRMPTTSETDRYSWRDEAKDEMTRLLQNSDGSMHGGGPNLRLGLAYNFTDKDVLSLSASGMLGERNRDNTIDYKTTKPGDILSLSDRISKNNTDHKMGEWSLDYTHTFSKKSDLRAAVSFDYMSMEGNSSYTQNNYGASKTDPLSTFYQLQHTPRTRRNWETAIDYTNAFTDKLKLEAGYKGDINSSDSRTTTWNDLKKEQEETSLYNDFRYDENIQALYATLTGKVGPLSFMGGLRGEYTHYTTSSPAKNETNPEKFTRDYFDLFPSAFVAYTFKESNELQLNYTRRVNRPRGRQLNPFKNISDSSNISFGNPLLLPEYTNSLELNYIKNWKQHTLSASLYYRSTQGVSQQISYLEGSTLYSTYDNVTDSRRGGVELVAKDRFFDWLDLTTTVNLYYYKLDGFDYTYGSTTTHYNGNEDFSWDARMIANVMLPWNLRLQLTGSYNSATYSPQGKNYDSYWLDAGLRRSFVQGKLTVAVTGRDLLDSRKRKAYTFGDNFSQTSIDHWGGRSVGFNISFNFGNVKVNKKKSRSNDQNNDSDSDMMDF